MFNIQEVSCELAGKTLKIETGKLAKQADGSVYVSYGDSRVLVTVCSAKEARPGQSFFPLTVEYAEKFYAAGKIPGSFFKREGRPTTDATLSARMIDRPIRPLFPEGYLNDTQIVATILSMDSSADVDVCASVGASAALHISDIPFNGPTAAVRVARNKETKELVVNPSWNAQQDGTLDLEVFVAGTKNAIMMVEGGALEVSEENLLEAVMLGHKEIQKLCGMIDELRKKCGKEKRAFEPPTIPSAIVDEVKKVTGEKLKAAFRTKEKHARYAMIDEAKKLMVEKVLPDSLKESNPEEFASKSAHAMKAFDDYKYFLMRDMILSDKIRIDGRDTVSIRPILTEVGLLPKAHGSALFTRGETQVLSTVTLGTGDDEQIIDTMFESSMNRYMLHYNFPPYSVGETGRMGGQSRREIGHGALAQRSLRAMIPTKEEFPYTLRIVCETLESNGSSSMGSVCAGSMAMMHAGVPMKKPIAGIAMGLIKEDSRVAVLSDILGDEDHLGDMDFKVAGTKDGVTGIQMDIKIEGVSEEIMKQALSQARDGRIHILGEMAKAITESQTEVAENAPRITTIQIPTDKIRDVIGSGGKIIKEIIAKTGAKVDISDDGTVSIASSDSDKTKAAIDWIKSLTATAEVGKTYKGTVKKVIEFGAIVSILPNSDGLLHISEIANERVNQVSDYLKEGDEVEVKVLDVDRASGRIKLSRRALLPGGDQPRPRSGDGEGGGGDRGDRGGRGNRDRGGRGGDRNDRRPPKGSSPDRTNRY